MFHALSLLFFAITAAFAQATDPSNSDSVDSVLSARCWDIKDYVKRTIELDDLIAHLRSIDEQQLATNEHGEAWALSVLYIEEQRSVPHTALMSKRAQKADLAYREQLAETIRLQEAELPAAEVEIAKQIAAWSAEREQLHRDISNLSVAKQRLVVQILRRDKSLVERGASTSFIPFDALDPTQCPTE